MPIVSPSVVLAWINVRFGRGQGCVRPCSERQLSAHSAERHDRPVADIGQRSEMLRSQPAFPTSAATAKIDASRTYSLWRGRVYRPRLLAWFTTALPDSCAEKSTGETNYAIISLFIHDGRHQVEQKACMNNWLNGNVDQSNLIWRFL